VKFLVIGLFLLLLVLHQDFWFWDSEALVFGFMPIGLAYHVAFSFSAALLWGVAIAFAWPTKFEAWVEQDR